MESAQPEAGGGDGRVRRVCRLAALGLLVLGGCGRRAAPPAETVSLSACLRDLTNVAVFARAPLGKAGMISTYDRTGGNQDYSSLAPPGPDGLIEVANLRGPGCVKRIWMTGGPRRHWVFFFDGEKEPRLRLTTDELFGGAFPFVPPVSDLVSAGRYSYLPVPFAKSLRIAFDLKYEPNIRTYYHLGYETYADRVEVESFPRRLSEAESELVRRVCRHWERKEAVLRRAMERCPSRTRLSIPAGGGATWLEAAGPGVIRCFWLRPDGAASLSAADREKLLRLLVLRMAWNGAGYSVDVPLGDFFCNAFHRRGYSALAMGHVDGAYVCRLPMPFAGSARAEIRNDSAWPVILDCGYEVSDKPAGVPGRYFHAGWNGGTSRGLPFSVLHAKGRGHYVGCYLNAIGTDGTWTILEGDEAIAVDGESVPSIRGTGLEDYFNGAWYYTTLFDLPLHGLLEKASIRTDQYRFHLADPIRFEAGIDISFEFGDGNRARGYMSATAYWYQESPSPAGGGPGPARQRFPPPDPFARVAIMGHLFELERIGALTEARDRCYAYAEVFPGKPVSDLMRLRGLAYEELLRGRERVAADYRKLADSPPPGAVTRQASDLLWFGRGEDQALLGVQANGSYRVYLDGKAVGRGGHPKRLDVYRVNVGPGEHVLTAEATAARPGAFLSICLRTQTTNVYSDASWEVAARPPAGWPAGTGAGTEWKRLEIGVGVLPTMYNMFFMPNAYVHMQSRQQTLNLWPGFKREPPLRQGWFRKRFIVPERAAPAAAEPGLRIERDEGSRGIQGRPALTPADSP